MLSKIKRIILKYKIIKSKKIYLVAGAANTNYQNWISSNIAQLDITKPSDFEFYFSNRKIEKFLLEHVVEHLEYDKFILFLQTVKKYLTKEATIRIAVPDAYHPSEYVRELTGVNGIEPGANDHKFFYSINDFEKIAVLCKYKIDKLEYFDESGLFHKNDFDFENGYISRCSSQYQGRFTNNSIEYDKLINTTPIDLRNQFIEKKISYTSLSVDFINI